MATQIPSKLKQLSNIVFALIQRIDNWILWLQEMQNLSKH